MTAPPRKRPRSVSASVASGPLREAELLDAREARRVERVPEPGERQRLVEAKPEHHALARADVAVELLELARRAPARRERCEVAPEPRRRCASACSSIVETAPIPSPR